MAGKQAKILSNDQVERLLSFAYYLQSPPESGPRVVIRESRVAGRGNRQPDLADGFGPRRRNYTKSRYPRPTRGVAAGL